MVSQKTLLNRNRNGMRISSRSKILLCFYSHCLNNHETEPCRYADMFVTSRCFKVSATRVSWNFICLIEQSTPGLWSFSPSYAVLGFRNVFLFFLPNHLPFGDASYLSFLCLTTLYFFKISPSIS